MSTKIAIPSEGQLEIQDDTKAILLGVFGTCIVLDRR